jgi:hypothetical protein
VSVLAKGALLLQFSQDPDAFWAQNGQYLPKNLSVPILGARLDQIEETDLSKSASLRHSPMARRMKVSIGFSEMRLQNKSVSRRTRKRLKIGIGPGAVHLQSIEFGPECFVALDRLPGKSSIS